MGGEALEAAKVRRKALHEAMIDFEARVMAASGAPGWAERLDRGLTTLREALDDHIVEVEKPNGIIARALDAAPWLESHAEPLRAEHVELLASLDAVADLAEEIDVEDRETMRDLRHASLDLVRHLSWHRQRGADLVYDAYDYDIGGMG